MMITREQIATVAATATFADGIALFVANALGPRNRLACSGVRLALSAVPLVIITRTHRAKRQVANSAETHRREGYRLALTHTSRGLLHPPQDNHGQGATARDAKADLSAVPSPEQAEGLRKRKAQ